MISSILSLRGVANPPFFQVLGKRRDGTPGGVIQISVVQDEALRPLHFCICVVESAPPGFVGVSGVGRGVGGGGGGVGARAVDCRSPPSVGTVGTAAGTVRAGGDIA